jgi:hypothetical protein
MFPVHCTDCGHELRDVNETPWPQCGRNRRTIQAAVQARSLIIGSAWVVIRSLSMQAAGSLL